ncbi:unnamed protein product [Cuscuta epithymum]|uniref:Uncharacterized protein n=1 Tax=Cuscuta epithymum TaxID=186058 RepID=A0AAV0C285_9ASTE|nr:unnamed protein product [Cuscuta epithymum]
MVEPHMVRILGRSAFHDTALTSSGDLCYLGGEWRREVAFAGFEVPIQMDVSAEKMIYGVTGVNPQRRDELIKSVHAIFDAIFTMGHPEAVSLCFSIWVRLRTSDPPLPHRRWKPLRHWGNDDDIYRDMMKRKCKQIKKVLRTDE